MKKYNDEVTIIGFNNQYSKDFSLLNIDWLERYFYVEPYDKEVLENPQVCILEKGGYIFFAKIDDQIVGTVALINDKECYELSKMAVSPKYQGQKIGQKLMNHCIEFSRQKNWGKIKLYSSTKLTPALSLYKKVGFKEVQLEKDVHYVRSDIKMILEL